VHGRPIEQAVPRSAVVFSRVCTWRSSHLLLRQVAAVEPEQKTLCPVGIHGFLRTIHCASGENAQMLFLDQTRRRVLRESSTTSPPRDDVPSCPGQSAELRYPRSGTLRE